MQLAADTQHRDVRRRRSVAAGGSQVMPGPLRSPKPAALASPAIRRCRALRPPDDGTSHEFGGRTGVNGPVQHIGFVSYDARLAA